MKLSLKQLVNQGKVLEEIKNLTLPHARKIGSELGVDRYCLDRASEVSDEPVRLVGEAEQNVQSILRREYWETQYIRSVKIAMLEEASVLEKVS
ncbi:MAG: hypothetical protein ACW987_19995 [Candidatus Thorarchaeota archaeon]|jgi:hypothetical protein